MQNCLELKSSNPWPKDSLVPVFPLSCATFRAISLKGLNSPEPLAAGSKLKAKDQELQILGNFTLGAAFPNYGTQGFLVKTLTPFNCPDFTPFKLTKEGYSLAVVTLSDSGSLGLREDKSGPSIVATLEKTLPLNLAQIFMLPDDTHLLRARLEHLALVDNFDLICTTGGTGLTPRDITPQTTLKILDYELPGFKQAMMALSLSKTPHACLSRATAGVLKETLIINLPGSLKAVEENLEAIIKALPHALAKLHNDPRPCGG